METSMPRGIKRTYGAQLKARVALAAIRAEHSLAEIAAQFEVSVSQIAQWKWLLIEHAEEVFDVPRRDRGVLVDEKSVQRKPR